MGQTEKKRNFILVNTESQINAILQQHIGKTELTLKEKSYPRVQVVQLAENNSLLIETEYKLEKEQEVVLFKVMARYLEIYCHVMKVINTKVKMLQVDKILIAANSRRFKRFKVEHQQAYITNIKIPKIDLNTDFYTAPTVVTVAFASFEKGLKAYADFVKIKTIDKDDAFEKNFAKKQKPLLLINATDPFSYKPDDDGLFDYAEFLGENLQKTINSNRARGIKSMLYMPVLQTRKNRFANVLGYIQLISYSKYFTPEILKEMKEKSSDLLRKIQESNSTVIKEKQYLADMSVQGMGVEISEMELQKSLPLLDGFYFDLVIRDRPPVSLFANTISVEEKNRAILLMGLQLPESSNTPESLKVYHGYLRYHVEETAKEKNK